MPKNRNRSRKTSINVNFNGKDKGYCWHCHRSAGGVYGLGIIGAAVYYIQTATGFWSGVLGILKAIVWPAFLVYHLLGL